MRPRIRRTRQGWEVLRDGAILGPYRTRAEAERWATVRPRRNPAEWQEAVANEEDVSPYVANQMPDVVGRARSAGARPPLEYLGAGASGVVLCDARGRGYKVARTMRQAGGLEDEAEWMQTARQVPGVREHVAAVYGFHPREGVIERECVRGKVAGWGQEGKLFDLHRGIETSMLQYGWGSPEFKGDSYVMVRGRGPVLVDAGMANRTGTNLARRAAAVLSGRAVPRTSYEAQMLPGEVRMELDRTIPRAKGEQLLRRIAPQDNPRPAAWGKLRGSTPYPCKARAVGKQVRRQGRQYTVESCATPAHAKPAVGQFWLTRPGAPGHAVPRPAVSRALRRGAKPPTADLFARWGRRPAPPGSPGIYTPERFGGGAAEPTRRGEGEPERYRLADKVTVEMPEVLDEWEERVIEPASRWRAELWIPKHTPSYERPETLLRVVRYDARGHREVLGEVSGALPVGTYRARFRSMPGAVASAIDGLLRESRDAGWPVRQELEAARYRPGFVGGMAQPPDSARFKDGAVRDAYRAARAWRCADDGGGYASSQERNRKVNEAKRLADAAFGYACGDKGSIPPSTECADLYLAVSDRYEHAGCERKDLQERRCSQQVTEDQLNAWATGQERMPDRGPFDSPVEHQPGGASDCCVYSAPSVQRRNLHRAFLAGLGPGDDREAAIARAEEGGSASERATWQRCDERVRREVEKRRAAMESAEGMGGDTSLELLIRWWRAARAGDQDAAMLWGGRAISEGAVKYEPEPGWESDPGDAQMMDSLLGALEDAPVSSQRKRAILAEIEKHSTARVTPALRARVLGGTMRREAASRAQRTKAGAWKMGR